MTELKPRKLYPSNILPLLNIATTLLYYKRANIRWAKHSQFQPYEIFHDNTFVMPWLAVFIGPPIINYLFPVLVRPWNPFGRAVIIIII